MIKSFIILLLVSLSSPAWGQLDEMFMNYLDDGVITSSGKITGQLTRFYGQAARAYLGVPYAKPPVGDLRFKKPEPIEDWDGTLDAVTMPPACMQSAIRNFPWYDSGYNKSEDCLYLNIWSPRFSLEERTLPVIFYIYGGMYSMGSNRITASNGLGLSMIGLSIVVTPNYRVGPFGFFGSGTEDAPGNVGIYDILLALNWVKQNAASFGGDPDKITIMGQGSGSEIVSLLLMSPLAKGLFNQAIMESGSFLTGGQANPPFITPLSPKLSQNFQLGQTLAEAVGCTADNQTLFENPDDVVACLKGVNAKQLSDAYATITPSSGKGFVPQYGDSFLPNDPVEDFKNGFFENNVNLMIGSNRDEGSFMLTLQEPELFGEWGMESTALDLSLGKTILEKSFRHLPEPESIVRQYLEGVDADDYDQIRRQVYTALGDFNVTCPTSYFAERYGDANNTVLYYIFGERPKTSPWAPWMGATHYDETPYVFARPIDGYDYNTFMNSYNSELGLSYAIASIWGDFAKKGRGLSMWKGYSSTHHQYVLLQYRAKKKMRGPGPHLDNCNFFRKYFDL